MVVHSTQLALIDWVVYWNFNLYSRKYKIFESIFTDFKKRLTFDLKCFLTKILLIALQSVLNEFKNTKLYSICSQKMRFDNKLQTIHFAIKVVQVLEFNMPLNQRLFQSSKSLLGKFLAQVQSNLQTLKKKL